MTDTYIPIVGTAKQMQALDQGNGVVVPLHAAAGAGASALIRDIRFGVTQAASLTYEYELMPGTFRETAVVDNSVQGPFRPRSSCRAAGSSSSTTPIT